MSADTTTLPPPNKVAALHRSVTCGDVHMLLKVVYDPDRVPDDDTKTEKMPVVLFLNGADCPHESYMWLASRLAHQGFCVVLSSCVVSFGPSTVLLSNPFNLNMLQTLEDYKKGPSNEGIAAVLDHLQSLEAEPLSGKLDMNRIIVGGHSSGGRTVLDLVSFDNPFNIVAAFTYGTSLVVSSGGSGFAKRGSIVPCDSKSPPPLLLLGGSEDGISGRISSTGDATETLNRSMKEGFEQANGDADLIIIKGSNHMAFCSPVDPACGAISADRPLAVNGEVVRKVLGNVICDFLKSHGLPDGSTQSDFQPKIPLSMLHTVETYRPEGSSNAPLFVIDSDEEQQEEAWETLSTALDDWISKIAAELQLEPSQKLDDNTRHWTTGNLTGSLQAWESTSVAWAVRYGNSYNEASNSLGFNVWLDSTGDAPHLTVYVGIRGNRVTFMADHLPRFDLATHPRHLERYYGGDRALSWSELQNADKVNSFSSGDPRIRAVQSPNALALSTDLGENDSSVDALLKALNDHCETWMKFVQEASPLNNAEVITVSERDLAVRQVLCNHERTAGERFMDKDLAHSLANNMAGFV